MNTDLQNKLFSDFPKLFIDKDLSPQESCMYFGVDCGDGWYNIIRDACVQLNALNISNLKFHQIKEKWGTLCLYVNLHNKEIAKILNEAEQQSSKICEICGGPSQVNWDAAWVTTRCKKCRL